MSETNIDILTGEYVTLSYAKADIGKRFFAVMLDWIILALSMTIVGNCMAKWDFPNIMWEIVFTMLGFADLILEYFLKGQTLGKMALGIKIINDECTPPTFLQCFIRWAIFPIDFFLVGLILIGAKGQRLGDMAAGCQCIVCRNNEQKKVELPVEFKYTMPNYKVRYEKAGELKKETINKIRLILFAKSINIDKDDMVNKLKKYLDIHHPIAGTDLLMQVYNDYMYLHDN